MKVKRLVLLLLIFVLYVSLGALVFNVLEAGAEQERKDELQTFVEQFLGKSMLSLSCSVPEGVYVHVASCISNFGAMCEFYW